MPAQLGGPAVQTYEFGLRVRERRLVLGLTIREAARRLMMSPSRLGAIEKGIAYSTGNPTRPRREAVERIADVYGLPREILLAAAGFTSGTVADLDEEARHLLMMFAGLNLDRKQIALGFMRVLSEQA
jgi:transcriptional regulator with XRE-family HTH domain